MRLAPSIRSEKFFFAFHYGSRWATLLSFYFFFFFLHFQRFPNELFGNERDNDELSIDIEGVDEGGVEEGCAPADLQSVLRTQELLKKNIK